MGNGGSVEIGDTGPDFLNFNSRRGVIYPLNT